MKKLLSLLLCLSIAVLCVSCGSNDGESSDQAQKAIDGTTTLMIYMIGSDLESKSGAATDDIAEMEQSGVDLSRCSVVLCTGGSSQWHTELADNTHNTILSLRDGGFVQEQLLEPSPMGDAETLSSFLNYCTGHHPADHYALILWDHGSGPLVGYGKDTLNEGDSLTLPEMAQALQDSPFSKELQLDWVGFDACLMASAELACVWKDYARYMVASQEVEPSFGWSYGFLSQLGFTDTPTLICDAAERYLQTCLDYYDRKGYHDRDTTLSCLDLSYAGELNDSIDALFSAACADVATTYDRLAACRVSTRALGRASTGSEYDLVDLKDLSEQLSGNYPDQAQRIISVIDRMVIKNAANADALCGLSLYYPFYNKSYYSGEWSSRYRDMNLFPGYLEYLSQFEKTWLCEDMLDDYAASSPPSVGAQGSYTLELTADQAAHFANAKYYILKKEGAEAYTPIFSCSDVSFSDGRLSASFDGNVIYAHDLTGSYILPVTTQHDTVGSITNYSAYVTLDSSMGISYLAAPLEGQNDVRFKKCRFLIAADKAASKIAVSALMPADTTLSGSDLMGGKEEEVDTSEFTTYLFMDADHYAITRTDNGVIRPVKEWRKSGTHSWNEISIADGVEFVYAPLAYGSYSLIFEICDTQGSSYCSSPIDIDVSGIDWIDTSHEEEETVVSSDGTFPVLLKEDDRLALYLNTYRDKNDLLQLTTYAVNKTDDTIYYSLTDVVYNKDILNCGGSAPLAKLGPHKESYPYSDYGSQLYKDAGITQPPDTFDFGYAADIGMMKKISSLSFNVKAVIYENKKTVWRRQRFTVNFDQGKEFTIPTEQWNVPLLDSDIQPPFGAQIKPQKLVDNSQMLIELLCFGETSKDYIQYAFRIVNRSSETILLDSDGLAIDDIFCDVAFSSIELPPGMQAYYRCLLRSDKLAACGIDGMQKLQFSFRTASDSMTLWQGYGTVKWYDAVLSSRSPSPSSFRKTSSVLMDENDVTVSYVEYRMTDYGTRYWYMAVDNRRSEGVRLDIESLSVNGTSIPDSYDLSPVYITSDQVGPGQRGVVWLATSSITDFDQPVEDLSFRFTVYNFTGEKILFHSKTSVNLKAQ